MSYFLFIPPYDNTPLQDTYSLATMKTLEEAVKSIMDFLGLMPCERSDKVPEGKSSHSLFLAGEMGGVKGNLT